MDLLKVLFIAAAIALTGCSKDLSNQVGQRRAEMRWELRQLTMSDAEKAATLRVTDMNGRPISGAQVLVGEALNEPFASNFVTTDADGAFIAPEAWTMEQTVTISAVGFVRASYMGQTPAGQAFQLRPSIKEKKYELKGQGTGFKVIDKDDKIDFALMIPVLKKNDLFAFDLTKFISPQLDEISVYGQKIQMPSNISLPKQKETYSLFTVTLEKPIFRVYFENLGAQKVMAARGQFPFNKVVKEMQNKKPFFELINYFSIQGGSLKTVNIAGNTQNMDLPVNDFAFTVPKAFKAPVLSNNEKLIAIPLAIYDGEFFPTDLKNVASNTSMNLMTAQGQSPQLVTVVMHEPGNDNKMDGCLSVNIGPFEAGVAPQMLPLIDRPQILSMNELKIKPVNQPQYLRAIGMYSLLSTVEKQNLGNAQIEITHRMWEVYGKGWSEQVNLPTWPDDIEIQGQKRWEVSLVGSPDKAIDLGPVMLENATHATHSQADF